MTKKRTTSPSSFPGSSTAKAGATSSPAIPKHPGGRPRIIESPEEAQELGEAYFMECDTSEPKRPYTVPGLAYALGLSSRVALFEYEKRPEFFNTIKRLKARIEAQRNEQLITDNNAAGKIFDLKNNFGWIDSQHIAADLNVRTLTDDELQEEISKLEGD